jgi:hypothetical protein
MPLSGFSDTPSDVSESSGDALKGSRHVLMEVCRNGLSSGG